MTHAIIGIDLGATTTAGGLVTREGELLHVLQRPTHGEGPGTALTALLRLVGELEAEGEARGLALDGVGVGVAGVVDVRKGAMQPHPQNSLPELGHVSLTQELRAVTDLPVCVDNDANALALAEWLFGGGRGAHSLVLIAIGTGVGGGIILGDMLIRGASGCAGELHGIPINIDGRPCYCGGRGCFGGYVEGRAIVAEVRDQLAEGAPSSLPAMAHGDTARITPELIFRAATAGDPLAKTIVDRACDALGAAIAFVINALNPEVIVITGGVARSLVPLAAEVRRRAAPRTLGPGVLAGTQIHIVDGDKQRTVRGGAALVIYETGRGMAAPTA
jgi:glucokinase